MRRALAGPTLLLGVLAGIAGCREPNGNPLQPAAAPAAAGKPAGRGETGPVPVTLCNIEYADGTLLGMEAVAVRPGAVVRGWLGSAGGALAAPRLVVAGAGGGSPQVYPLQLGIEREDVARAHPDLAGLERSGFEQTLGALAGTPPFHLYLLYDSGPTTYVCDNGRRVVPAP